MTYTYLPKPSWGSLRQDNKLISFFGRASYSYLDRYFAQYTLRREGSSKFGANNKWGSFPAVSLGWVLSDEGFMENQDIFSFLKFRVGYGITGNQGIPNYNSLVRSEEHTSELQSRGHLVCRLLLEK